MEPSLGTKQFQMPFDWLMAQNFQNDWNPTDRSFNIPMEAIPIKATPVSSFPLFQAI